jgi:hypothetical protein
MQNYFAALPLRRMMLNSPGDEKFFTRMDVKGGFGATAERTHHRLQRPTKTRAARMAGFE